MNPMQKAITAILIGAGHRGREIYGKYAQNHPDQLKFIALAEPNKKRQIEFQKIHNIPASMVFPTWKECLNENLGRLADIAVIATQDRMHFQPAMKAMDLGYNLLLEKPISPNLIECQELDHKAKKTQRKVQVAHVLRYTPFFKKIKEIIDSDKLGKIIQYYHSENVSYWHFGHSYVRGPYKNESDASAVILAKCCHDLDIMYWLIGEKPLSVQSSGSLSFYKPENAPPNAPDRCTDGCPHEVSCPWFAPRLYLEAEPIFRLGQHAPSKITRFLTNLFIKHKKLMKFLGKFNSKIEKVVNWRSWPTTAITDDLSFEGKMNALKTGPYGLCIYKSTNDVVDHQTAIFTFPDGVTGTLQVCGLSDLEGREIKIFGTKGVIRGIFRYNEEKITFRDFRYNNTQIIYHHGLDFDPHGGGDEGLISSFIHDLQAKKREHLLGTTDIHESLESHYMGFAAEDARKQKKTLSISPYRSTTQK
jgi:predicted dehydrogenase